MSILEQAATARYAKVQNQSVKLFTDTIGGMAHVASEYNQRGDVKKTMLLADFCWAVLDVGIGVCEGAIDGASNVVHMIAHPVDTVINTVHGVSTAAYCTGKVLYEICGITKDCLIDFDSGMDRINRAHDNIKAITFELGNKISTMTPRQMARAVISVPVEVVVTKKCMTTMHRFYQGAQAQIAVAVQKIERGMRPQYAFAGAGYEYTLAAEATDSLLMMEEGGDAFKAVGKKAKKIVDSSKSVSNKGVVRTEIDNSVKWTPHDYRHVPQKNLSWHDIIKTTKHGKARYKPGVDIEFLERFAWKHGLQATRRKDFKVIKFDYPIGANSGAETCYMRVEMNANTIHGHPITAQEYRQYLKPLK